MPSEPQSTTAEPMDLPGFLMWAEPPAGNRSEWKRQWFGHELSPGSVFNVRGIGLNEPLFNPDVHRPYGTGDWLIMLFQMPPRLDRQRVEPSHGPMTLVIWPPGAEQFYSWGEQPNREPHSWMHVEGTWVATLFETLDLPINQPLPLPDESIMNSGLTLLLEEMRLGMKADPVILQNIFENWARRIRRQLQSRGSDVTIQKGLLRVRRRLDSDYRAIPPLDELAALANLSRSRLCHRFRECFGSSISEYVIRKRMAAAQRMLFEVSLRPGEIAEALGYTDIYQFSKQFKKTFGVSPTAFRKQQHILDS
ncbi:MAG: AraC family transcriptional regulator [Planctomycetota bacterium]